MHRKFQSQDVVFLGITSQDKKYLPQLKQFLETYGINWPNAYGVTATSEALKVNQIPAVWVIGRDGKVAWNSGESSSLEEGLEKALAAKP